MCSGRTIDSSNYISLHTRDLLIGIMTLIKPDSKSATYRWQILLIPRGRIKYRVRFKNHPHGFVPIFPWCNGRFVILYIFKIPKWQEICYNMNNIYSHICTFFIAPFSTTFFLRNDCMSCVFTCHPCLKIRCFFCNEKQFCTAVYANVFKIGAKTWTT